MIKYEKNLVNGKFYEVKQTSFTDEEWDNLCSRFGQDKTKKHLDWQSIFATLGIIVCLILAILIHL